MSYDPDMAVVDAVEGLAEKVAELCGLLERQENDREWERTLRLKMLKAIADEIPELAFLRKVVSNVSRS